MEEVYLTLFQMIKIGIKAEPIVPGNPAFDQAFHYADDISLEFPSTSHISIVDSYGNALSMTTTIENVFGSRLMTKGGFLLNNELTIRGCFLELIFSLL